MLQKKIFLVSITIGSWFFCEILSSEDWPPREVKTSRFLQKDYDDGGRRTRESRSSDAILEFWDVAKKYNDWSEKDLLFQVILILGGLQKNIEEVTVRQKKLDEKLAKLEKQIEESHHNVPDIVYQNSDNEINLDENIEKQKGKRRKNTKKSKPGLVSGHSGSGSSFEKFRKEKQKKGGLDDSLGKLGKSKSTPPSSPGNKQKQDFEKIYPKQIFKDKGK